MKDWFRIPLLGPLLRSPWSWLLARWLLLAALVAVIAWGWHQHAIPGVAARDPLMYTNLATFAVWVAWLMGVVVLAALVGRFWCACCPVGWLTGLCARIGLERRLPAGLSGFLVVTLTLIALQLAVYFFALHRFPDYTAWLLALMLLLAVGAGLLFRGRAFCRLFCPAGAVFGLYGRVAAGELGVRDPAVCAACPGHDCVRGTTAWRRFGLGRAVLYWERRREGCPVELPAEGIGQDPECVLCLNCVRNCPFDNLRLGLRARRPAASGLGRGELGFFLVLFGLLLANFSKVNVTLREFLFWLPETAARALDWGAPGFYLLGTPWLALGLPLLLLLPGLLLRRLLAVRGEPVSGDLGASAPLGRPEDGPGARLGQLALPLLPLLLAAHVVLALVKLNAKGAYLALVLGDPTGVRSYLAIHVMQTMTQPGVLVSIELLKWLVLGVLLAGLALSGLLLVRLAPAHRDRGAYLAGGGLVSLTTFGLLLWTVIAWLFVR